jgi:hypothetical protein
MNNSLEIFFASNDVMGLQEYVLSSPYINLRETILTCIRIGFSKGACHLLTCTDKKLDQIDMCLYTAMSYNEVNFVDQCLNIYSQYDYKIEDYPESRINIDGYSSLKIIPKPWILYSQSPVMLSMLLDRIPRLRSCLRSPTCASNPDYCRCDLINFRQFEGQSLAHELITNNASVPGQASELLSYLQTRGLDPNLESTEGSLFHHCLFYHDLASIKFLHHNGAKLNIIYKYGYNILDLIIFRNDLDTLNYVLKHCTKDDLLDHIQKTLSSTIEFNQSESYKRLLQEHNHFELISV